MSMKLEQQVCSLDLAKRLKELGVKQESVCWFTERYQLSDRENKTIGARFNSNPDFSGTAYSYHHEQDICAAFTVTELGLVIAHAKSDDVMKAYGYVWNVPDTRVITELGLLGCMTDPDMAAKMLVYLLENHLLDTTK